MGSYRKIIEKSRRKKFLPTPTFSQPGLPGGEGDG
jgi:hypothetical protein